MSESIQKHALSKGILLALTSWVKPCPTPAIQVWNVCTNVSDSLPERGQWELTVPLPAGKTLCLWALSPWQPWSWAQPSLWSDPCSDILSNAQNEKEEEEELLQWFWLSQFPSQKVADSQWKWLVRSSTSTAAKYWCCFCALRRPSRDHHFPPKSEPALVRGWSLLLPHRMRRLGHFGRCPLLLLFFWKKVVRSWNGEASSWDWLPHLRYLCCVFVRAAAKMSSAFWNTAASRSSSGVSWAEEALYLHVCSYFQVQTRHTCWHCVSAHEYRGEMQPSMLRQKMSFIAASPALVFKIFLIGSTVCFPTPCAGNPKGLLESMRMPSLWGDSLMTSSLVQR